MEAQGLSLRREGSRVFLHDPERLADPRPGDFDPERWEHEGRVRERMEGRGPVWVLEAGDEEWVLRHYRRGGLIRHLSRDRYVWTGAFRSRPLRELTWLARLRELGLPVPPPVAAMVERSGVTYRGDILTVRVPGEPLGAALRQGRAKPEVWGRVGVCIGRLHGAGVHHPDLNVDNVLVAEGLVVHLVDFDRARQRRLAPSRSGLRRFLRSAAKTVGPEWKRDPRWERCRERLRVGYREGRMGRVGDPT